MASIADLLQLQPYSVVAKELIVKTVSTKSPQLLEIAFFRFFIDILGKNYDFDEEILNGLTNEELDIESVVIQIYQADNIEEISSEVPIHEFIQLTLNEYFVILRHKYDPLINWISFLTAITDHNDIPKNVRLKGKAYMLLSFMLEPLINLQCVVENESGSEDLSEELILGPQRIINSIADSIEYEEYGIICARQYEEVVEFHADKFVGNAENLIPLKKMLQYDNRLSLMLAIKSIDKLCQDPQNKEQVKNFIFVANNEDPEGERETVFEIILRLIDQKNLKYEILTLLKSVVLVSERWNNHKILSSNERFEIFINVFNKNKKIVNATAALMFALERDFWSEIIYMIDNHIEDDDFDLLFMLGSIEGSYLTDINSLLSVVIRSIGSNNLRRATEIFTIAFKSSSEEEKESVLKSTIETLEKCKDDEAAFVILLQALMEVKDETLVDFLTENKTCLIRTLMPCISNAFVDFDKPISLNVIVNSLKKLYIIDPVIILPRVRFLAKEYYKQIKSFKKVEFKEREKLIPKLSNLFEIKSWSLLGNNDLEDLYKFCLKYCNNVQYTFFPQFQRLLVNLLKHIWQLMMAKRPMTMDCQKLIVDIQTLHKLILSALNNASFHVADKCLLLSSLTDLYVFFQPSMKDKCNHDFFQQFKIPLSKTEMQNLVDQIAENVFAVDEDALFYQQSLIQCFVNFYESYLNLPSLTAWEAFLQHFNAKNVHKEEIEKLMNRAMAMKQSIFEKSVAFAILNLSQNASIEQFKLFYSAFDNYMQKTLTDVQQRNIRIGIICSVILDRFSKQIASMGNEGESRLAILDFITHMVKNSNRSFAKSLIKYVNINIELLSEDEIHKLEDFKNTLNTM